MFENNEQHTQNKSAIHKILNSRTQTQNTGLSLDNPSDMAEFSYKVAL